MNGRLKGTLATINRYALESDRDKSDEYGVTILQNIMETCRLELIEQRKLGVSAPVREPVRTGIRWSDALIGMQGNGDK